MITYRKEAVPFCRFENLSRFARISHFVSTREAGTGEKQGRFFDLSTGRGDSEETARQNRRSLLEAIGAPNAYMITARQVHGARVKIVSRSFDDGRPPDAADALVTDVPGACITVLTADCVPILLYDPVRKVVGAVHAGWKGTLQAVAAKTVAVLEAYYASDPRDILAGIGPSIGPCCFEVGPDVSRTFARVLGRRHILPGANKGRETIDLWGENARQLRQAGVKDTHIERADLCTCHHVNRFFSHRCEGGETGRFATGIVILDH